LRNAGTRKEWIGRRESYILLKRIKVE
jgi:hypothetical protein